MQQVSLICSCGESAASCNGNHPSEEDFFAPLVGLLVARHAEADQVTFQQKAIKSEWAKS